MLDPGVGRRKMLVQVEVSENFERRLDNQGDVQREIDADRWSWRWGSLEEIDRLLTAGSNVLARFNDLTDQYGLGEPLSDLYSYLDPDGKALWDEWIEAVNALRAAVNAHSPAHREEAGSDG